MEIKLAVLYMQLGKCCYNCLPFLFLREAHSQSSIISLLILLMTDTVITGFFLFLWFSGWILSPSTDVVFLKFLSFQNETYRYIPLLIPWICLSEEWSRSRMNKWSGKPMAETPLSVQSRLLSLTCWLIAASYGTHMVSEYVEIQSECDQREWHCLFTLLNKSRTFDCLLPSIGLLLGTTLFYSTIENKETSIISLWVQERRTFKGLVAPILVAISTIVSFYFLPPFIAVSSWSILALDSVCGLLRLHISQPPSTVCGALEGVQVKNSELKQTKHYH
ncbi:uncharacterized protein [Phyllobates terribilis]|uniref:uncharacterized protein n=1 Tax=Phyllobates terribilis TaxID=111132 RepID=UPI003CCB5D4A